MTAQRPDRPVTVREEVALAEARDLPTRADAVERSEPIARKGKPGVTVTVTEGER